MAISDSRIRLKNIVDSTKSTFLDAVDKSKDTPSNSITALSASVKSALNKKAVSSGMTGYLDSVSKGVTSKAIKLGIHNINDDVECSSGVLKSDNSTDSRDLNTVKQLNTDCSPSTSSLLDNIFNAKRDMLSAIATITDDSISNIEDIVTKEVNNLIKNMSMMKGVIDELEMAKGVVDDLANLGTSLKIKADLKALSNICNKSSNGYTAGDSATISKYLLESALSVGDCLDPKNLLLLVSSLIENKIGTSTDIIAAFSSNFKTNEDPQVIEKLKVLSAIMKDTESSREPKSVVYTKGHVDNVLKSLDNSEVVSEGPATDYFITVETLDMLDNNWDKDVYGNPDYSKVKGNKHMTELASASLLSTSPSGPLTLTPKLSEDKLRSVSIVASGNN